MLLDGKRKYCNVKISGSVVLHVAATAAEA
jgi:hypothetical protein